MPLFAADGAFQNFNQGSEIVSGRNSISKANLNFRLAPSQPLIDPSITSDVELACGGRKEDYLCHFVAGWEPRAVFRAWGKIIGIGGVAVVRRESDARRQNLLELKARHSDRYAAGLAQTSIALEIRTL